ncbi:hypothetical protein Scep_020616 [Stephania cephalantha]|uniref:Uncharacterized protein n=1 Tax=Stephania cephalantha TaxID=152367 RepID=A0AAP0ID88_9MAGN
MTLKVSSVCNWLCTQFLDQLLSIKEGKEFNCGATKVKAGIPISAPKTTRLSTTSEHRRSCLMSRSINRYMNLGKWYGRANTRVGVSGGQGSQ